MGTLCGSILDETTKKRIEQRKNQLEKKSKKIIKANGQDHTKEK